MSIYKDLQEDLADIKRGRPMHLWERFLCGVGLHNWSAWYKAGSLHIRSHCRRCYKQLDQTL